MGILVSSPTLDLTRFMSSNTEFGKLLSPGKITLTNLYSADDEPPDQLSTQSNQREI